MNLCKSLSELQIDCDLHASTPLTSVDSTLTTPTNGSGNDEEPSNEWRDFYEGLSQTPPKDALDANFEETMDNATKLLQLSEDPDFQNKSFDALEEDQKAILVLIVVKNMGKIFGGIEKSAKILIKALHEDSKEYKRMLSFVRKGGDYRHPSQFVFIEKVSRCYDALCREYHEAGGTTIFQKHPNMPPFLHLQLDNSYICAYNACSTLLYYSSYQDDTESMPAIKTNLSRYIRDEIPGLLIANFTFTTVKGAYLGQVLKGLLTSFGTNDSCGQHRLLTHDEESLNYSLLCDHYLAVGCPFVLGIECFPGLENREVPVYTGKVADYYKSAGYPNERPKDRNDRSYHVLVCVGIKPRKNEVPPMLLLQDSCPTRPIFQIGLDLLMDMEINKLELYTVPLGWKFKKNMTYMVNQEVKALICGSPMALDGEGVPHIINTVKPTEAQQRDMSRYLDVVSVKRGQPIIFTS